MRSLVFLRSRRSLVHASEPAEPLETYSPEASGQSVHDQRCLPIRLQCGETSAPLRSGTCVRLSPRRHLADGARYFPPPDRHRSFRKPEHQLHQNILEPTVGDRYLHNKAAPFSPTSHGRGALSLQGPLHPASGPESKHPA